MTISILNYNMGNIQSVQRKIHQLGYSSNVITTAAEILQAEKIILPGVGHFGKAMAHLRTNGLLEALNHVVLEKKIPVLGICLGMQLMTKYSEEGETEGLGWFDARVIRFKVKDTLRYKVPHTGWNQLKQVKKSPLLEGINETDEFYFVHAYHVSAAKEEEILTTTEYAYEFVSALSRDTIFGVQFHPEKSHDAGTKMLRNFCSL